MNKLISIIMPVYNVDIYIAETINSVRQQTYQDWELIVVDDGSTDRTSSIVEALVTLDNRIRLVKQSNQGVASARNKGMSLANGEYISFLDGDDLWEPNFLEELVNAKKEGIGIVFCGFSRLYNNKRKKYKFQYMSGNILLANIKGIVWLHIGGVVIERDILTKYGISFAEGCSMGEDLEFIMKVLSVTKAQAISKELMLYRVRQGSACNSAFNWRKHIQVLTANHRVIAFIKNHYRGVDIDEVLQSLYKRIAYDSYRILWKMFKAGNKDDVFNLLSDVNFQKDLSNLAISELKMVDRMKYNIVKTENPLIWSMMRYLG
ncbi:MAG: glycosyltransferase family 2 protein [Negativicutes bacterium]|nr:glycosyltransferase family 2 protein [Negativicutes bacterium]